jgi:hypothetical protein
VIANVMMLVMDELMLSRCYKGEAKNTMPSTKQSDTYVPLCAI